MAKSFLILMLMTIQLLAGNGGSVSVCIKGDGSFCCFERGTSNCTHCEIPEEETAPAPEVVCSTEPAGCHCCSNEAESSCETDTAPRSEQFFESMANSVDPCGCTHIVLTHDQSSSCNVRAFQAADANRLVHAAFEVPALSGGDAEIVARQTAFQRFKPPPVTSQAIVVLSWVLIQC